jgi:hypothetical protein
VPWPTGWCSWRLPDAVAERTIRKYQAVAKLPWARSGDFRRDVRAAATAWAVMSTASLLRSALGDDAPPADPAKVMPPRRALILNRLAAVARYRLRAAGEPAGLGAFATELRAALVARRGEVALPYAPAF